MNNKKNILITGADGQLGMELRTLSKKNTGFNFLFTGRNELSITDQPSLEKYFSENVISYCINCAAYTAVDKAETDTEAAFELNTIAPKNLAVICKEYGAQLIHISTDYVFDGNSLVAYKESDATHPLGIYGISKLKGENAIFENNNQSLIIRTSWLYSSHGKNFVKTMLRLLTEKENISVVDDQFGSPTYAADLAEAILKIISAKNNLPAGIYHYCNDGITSWYEFALAIKSFIRTKCIVNPITTDQYPTAAKRPHYSVLDTTKFQQTFGHGIPFWKDSLEECLRLLEYE